MLKMGFNFLLSTDCKTDTLLTSVYDDTDATDDADDYNRVIGTALLKVFSCAKKKHVNFYMSFLYNISQMASYLVITS